LIPHGKVLSPSDYTLTLPDLPNLPNLLCPASGVHSSSIVVIGLFWGRPLLQRPNSMGDTEADYNRRWWNMVVN